MASYEFNGKRVFVLLDDEETRTYDLIAGICGITDALFGPMFDEINDNSAQQSNIALKVLTDQLYSAANDTPIDLSREIEKALKVPAYVLDPDSSTSAVQRGSDGGARSLNGDGAGAV